MIVTPDVAQALMGGKEMGSGSNLASGDSSSSIAKASHFEVLCTSLTEPRGIDGAGDAAGGEPCFKTGFWSNSEAASAILQREAGGKSPRGSHEALEGNTECGDAAPNSSYSAPSDTSAFNSGGA